jgi:MFS transporter, putative metabolite:H+ symporter
MTQTRKIFTTTVLVSALGYFVDIYDLLLFSIVRVDSLKALGFSGDKLLSEGIFLLNAQMVGLLIGGVVWGMLGDKRGRLSVLFGSIFLYSTANIANAFLLPLSDATGISPIALYGALRLLAGIGLAGELGAAVTLVSESLPREVRGYGTAIVAGVGVSGAVVAALVGKFFTWNTAYLTGGLLGLSLFVTRLSMLESGMFDAVKRQTVRRGDFFKLFTSANRLRRYVCCILIGVPIWFIIGILATLSPELAAKLNVRGAVTAGQAIMFTYIGLVVGDLASGFLSQYFRSRKKIVFAFQVLALALTVVYVTSDGATTTYFYALCLFLGVAAGYWAVFVTVAAEQFGTNLRATVATSAPNFVRGATVPLTLIFNLLPQKAGLSLPHSALAVGIGSIVIAVGALFLLEESHGKDLDFVEALD